MDFVSIDFVSIVDRKETEEFFYDVDIDLLFKNKTYY